MTERQAQRAILAMIGRLFPSVLVAHVPNGGHLAGDKTARFKQMGALKGDGLKPGFPDLIAVWNHGVGFMEVKRPGYTPSCISPAQNAMHDRLAELGFHVAIVTTPEEAYQFLADRGAPSTGRLQ